MCIKEPNITHVKLLQIENTSKLLVAICKLVISDSAHTPTSSKTLHSTSNSDMNNYDCDINSQSSLSTSPQQNTLLTASISSSSLSSQPQTCTSQSKQEKYKISILNLINGETLNEIVFNGDVLEMKSNAHLLCINSWNRIDAFDLNRFEHKFSINCCYSQVSKSTGQSINPFALGNRWLAFADNKVILFLLFKRFGTYEKYNFSILLWVAV